MAALNGDHFPMGSLCCSESRSVMKWLHSRPIACHCICACVPSAWSPSLWAAGGGVEPSSKGAEERGAAASCQLAEHGAEPVGAQPGGCDRREPNDRRGSSAGRASARECTHTHTYACTHTHTCVHAHPRARVHAHARVHTRAHTLNAHFNGGGRAGRQGSKAPHTRAHSLARTRTHAPRSARAVSSRVRRCRT